MAIRFLSGQTIDGNLTVSGNVQAATFNSLPIATGRNNQANKIVRTQGNGYVEFGWINSTSGNHTGSITRITASNDEYLRYVTPAQFRTGVTDGYYAPASTVSGVTSVATSNGLTGGTITTTGTLSMSGSYTGAFSVTGFTTSTTGFGINYVSGGTVPMVILANATTYGIFYRESSPDHIEFKHNNAVMQSFDGNGNVDIEGNLTLNNNIFTASGDLTINNPLDTNSNLIIAGRYDLGATTLSFRSGHGSNNNVWDMATILVEDDANYNGRIMFRTSPVGYGNTPTTKMTIRSTGAIAFGTSISAYGSSGQVLKSNGNTSPTWVDASTVIGGPYLPLSGGTVTGLTSFTASESIRLKGIRGQFTNEFMHLYNKVGIGNPAGWGQGETSTPNQGLSTYGAGYFAYGTGAASTFLGDLTVSKGTPIIKALDGVNNHYLFIAADANNSFMRSDNSLLLQVDGGNVTALSFDNVGSATFSGYTYFPNYLFHAGDTNTRIFFETGKITLRGDTSINLTGGNVGIGTTSPGALLDVGGGDGTPAGTQFRAVIKGTSARTLYLDSDTGGASMWWGNGNTPQFALDSISGGGASFWTNSGSWYRRMDITSAGKVGIGTSSPGNYDGESDDLVVFNSTTPGITIATDNTASRGALRFADGTSGNERYRGALEYNHSGDIMSFRTAGTQRMNLTSDGNLVIGGGSAYSGTGVTSLTVNNDSYPVLALGTLTQNRFAIISYGSYNLFASSNNFVFDSGRVGIGTTSPAGKLDVIIPNLGSSSGDEVNGVFIQSGRHDWIFKQIRTANGSDWNNTTLRLQTRVDSTLMSSIDFVTDSGYNRHIDINTASNSFNTRFTHDGKVGIGTNDPSSRLQVGSHMSGNELTIGGYYINGGGTLNFRSGHPNNSAVWNMAKINVTDDGNYNGRIEFRTTTSGGNSGVQPSTKMVLKANGRLGIGTTSPASLFHVRGTQSYGTIRISPTSANGESAMGFFMDTAGTTTSSAWIIGHAGWGNTGDFVIGNQAFGGPVILVQQNGNVGIGTTSPSYTLDAAGTIRATGDVIAYSDARVKDNVKTIDNALEKVKKLRGVSYTRNDIEDKSTKVGVIAQEVLKVLPEVVDQDENDKYSVSYGNITGVLIEAIKEQQKQIEYLKIQIKNMSKDN